MTRQFLKGLFLFLLISISQMPYAFSQSCDDVITFYADGSTDAPSGSTLITGTSYNGSAFTYVMPAGFISVKVEVWGGGGAGGQATTTGKGNEASAGGGGGGGYSSYTFDTFEGDVLSILVGNGGTSGSTPVNGSESFISQEWDFNGENGPPQPTPSSFVAFSLGGTSSGNNKNNSAGSGGAGASTIGAIGTTTYSGGNGANPTAATGGKKGTNAAGGGGGSSAGTAANGTNGSADIGGTAPTDGGDGGDGGTTGGKKGTAAAAGATPGGGGGGAVSDGGGTESGGDGGDGLVRLTLYCDTPPDIGDCGTASLVEVVAETTELNRVVIQIDGACNWTVPADADEDGGLDILVLGAGGGGGAQAGGGGGAGGLIQVNIANLTTASISPGISQFQITAVGSGGAGTDDPTVKGTDGGTTTIIPFSGFTISAGGGGGGGSEEDTSTRPGRNGLTNTITGSATGFSVATNVGGSAGGAGHARDNTTSPGGSGTGGGNDAGDSVIIGGNDTHAGGGGGGANSAGGDTSGDEQGGDGGDGLTFSIFGDRYYSAGGGGGGRTAAGDPGGTGGSSNAGGTGGNDDALALAGQTPGSGGGGADHDKNSGGNGADGAVIISYLLPRVLPIEYLYFTAVYNPGDRSGELTWATAKEWDNSHFEIERSENNVSSWTKIGELKGAVNSNTPVEYLFIDDKLPLSGGNIFYRIKQVDLDGDYTYSRTRALQVEPARSSMQWRVYPNPTTGRPFNIELSDALNYGDEPITIRVISMTGQTEVIRNNNIQTMSDFIGEWFTNQVNGVYTLEISWGIHREYHKVILRK